MTSAAISSVSTIVFQFFLLFTNVCGNDTNLTEFDTSYHQHEENSPKDRCGYDDPRFPYALSELSGNLLIFTIVHGAIMVWVFVFFIPISIFPVVWRRIGPNDLVGRRQVRRWLQIHINFTRPVFPLMTVSVGFAMYVKHQSQHNLKNTSCSYFNIFHEMMGIWCYLVYAFHYYMGFFSHDSLHNDVYRSLRVFHSISNAFGYALSVPLMAMARLSDAEGSKRYLYIIPYFYFFVSQVNIHIRMKFADYGALTWHMQTEDAIANENKGVKWRLSQWIWNFGQPKGSYDSHLVDLQPQRSTSRIRIQQFAKTYNFYWKRTRLGCLLIASLMTTHLGLLHTKIYLSSANYFPNWHTVGDFFANWSLLEIYAL